MRGRRLVMLISIAVVAIATGVVRFSGLNPDSLWYDDLAWAALIRAPSISAMLRGPTHAPPGFLILLRTCRSVFADPEWSLQLPAYLSGIAAILVMAMLVRRLSGSDGLAVLAAGLTALNPLLAHYSVYVKQYSLDFLATATILLVVVSVLERQEIRAGQFGRVLLVSASALLFSLGSIFVSAPAVGVVTLRAWWSRRRGSASIVLLPLAFLGVLVGVFFWLRPQYPSLMPDSIYRAFFQHSFNARAIRKFILDNARTVEISLPSWTETEPWNPSAIVWTLPFIGLGLVWLLARRASRLVGLIIVGFLLAYSFAAFTELYPLTTDRRAIFAFPIFIALAVMGLHCMTEWLPRREDVRLAIGAAVAIFALYAPVHVVYWGVNDKRVIEHLSKISSGEGLILSPDGVFLAAYYGPWPIVVAGREMSAPEAVNIDRPLTTVALTKEKVQQFLGRARPPLLWYVAFRGSPAQISDVVSALQERGYDVQPFDQTTKATLYLGVLK